MVPGNFDTAAFTFVTSAGRKEGKSIITRKALESSGLWEGQHDVLLFRAQ